MRNLYFLIMAAIVPVSGVVHSCADPEKNPQAYCETTLNDWKFREHGSGNLLSAAVPGTVHTDLMKHGLIPDPFVGVNEEAVQWVSDKTWEYVTILEPEMLSGFAVNELVFEGLDTHAEIFLNDSLILSCNNQFRRWVVPLNKDFIKKATELKVIFYPAAKYDSIQASLLPYALPDNRAFSRKSPYHYGWDWGPRLITCGIWKPVYIRQWNKFRVADIQVVTKKLNEALAEIEVVISYIANENGNALIELVIPGTGIKRRLKHALRQGENTVSIPVTIKEPELWFPAGLGKAHLYNLEIATQFNKTRQTSSQQFGLRTVELVREKDSAGESFYFRINGLPVFAKGANYVPPDNFAPRVTAGKHLELLQMASDANFNMLRVWGGGYYENDRFYQLCDSLGIMVWQDFMFACMMYPGDEAFIENVGQEVREQVQRLRNHPSIVLWCGNNEVDEGWHNWGWQRQLGYTDEIADRVWNDYEKVFHELIPEIIRKEDPAKPYWSSSPSTGWGRPESLLSGDLHYWGVWWGEEPFEMYRKKVGRFMSEFGFQAYPHPRSIAEFAGSDITSPDHPAMQVHQKHPRGRQLIHTYMQRDFPVPDDFIDYVFMSQLVQAYGISMAVEAHRTAMPYCMGTLYWQFNDCWPVTSWSSLDWYGRPKALHYYVKRLYADFLFSATVDNDTLLLKAVNDSRKDEKLNFVFAIFSSDGKEILKYAAPVSLEAQTVKVLLRTRLEDLVSGLQPTKVVGFASLTDTEGNLKAKQCILFEKPRNLELSVPEFRWEISGYTPDYRLTLQSNVPALDVWIFSETTDFAASDNFISLMPGEPVNLTLRSQKSLAELQRHIRIKSLNEFASNKP